jgi:hypothetical protein
MKITIAAIILAVSIQLSNSQLISNIGVKGGVTFSNQDYKYHNGDNFFDFKTIPGCNGSLFAEFLSTKNYCTVFEAGYEQRGLGMEIVKTDEFGNELGRYTIRDVTHYATFGLLGKFKVSSKPVSAYFTAGPRMDLYLGYTEHVPSGEVELNAPNTILENFEKVNYSFTFGTGIELTSVRRFRPFVEFNYSPAVARSYENSSIYVKEHYFNIKAGIYIFDFGKKK